MSRLPSKKKQQYSYARYSSLSLQMLVIIFLGTWGGFKLDKYLDWGFPLFSILLSMIAIAVGIYLFIKDLK